MKLNIHMNPNLDHKLLFTKYQLSYYLSFCIRDHLSDSISYKDSVSTQPCPLMESTGKTVLFLTHSHAELTVFKHAGDINSVIFHLCIVSNDIYGSDYVLFIFQQYMYICHITP